MTGVLVAGLTVVVGSFGILKVPPVDLVGEASTLVRGLPCAKGGGGPPEDPAKLGAVAAGC